jgi:Fe-S oxidoreductase
VIGTSAEKKLLSDIGLDAKVLNSGCCGVAGSFGYEHYDVSMKIGEQVLLPAVRDTPKDMLIISDGFSCRSQIEHGTDRRALHTAEVLQIELHNHEARCPYPETGHVQVRPRALSNWHVTGAMLLVA